MQKCNCYDSTYKRIDVNKYVMFNKCVAEIHNCICDFHHDWKNDCKPYFFLKIACLANKHNCVCSIEVKSNDGLKNWNIFNYPKYCKSNEHFCICTSSSKKFVLCKTKKENHDCICEKNEYKSFCKVHN
jgi:hypothetical protein